MASRAHRPEGRYMHKFKLGRASVFPQATKTCVECGKTHTNNSTEFQTVGHVLWEVPTTASTSTWWFCSMVCVIKGRPSIEGLRLLADL